MLSQLHTPIPIQTPKGKAWAVAIIDYGPQWDLQWVSFVHDSGECWTFRNSEIRQEKNYTFGLPKPSEIKTPEEMGPMRDNIIATQEGRHPHANSNGNGKVHMKPEPQIYMNYAKKQ